MSPSALPGCGFRPLLLPAALAAIAIVPTWLFALAGGAWPACDAVDRRRGDVEFLAHRRRQRASPRPLAAEGRAVVNGLLILIPITLGLGALGLLAFPWGLRSGQFDDLDGAAGRVLFDDEPADAKDKRPANRFSPARRSS
jgi:cbb3-type cytochrome oxidase maturation protein